MHAKAIVARCNQYNLKLKRSALKLGQSTMKCLGHVINRSGISIEENKLRTIMDWELPATGAGLQSFLGLITFVRQHVRHIADLTAPLEAIKHHKQIQWTDELKESFAVVKNAFASAPLLAYPDYNKAFYIACDASNLGVGGVLYQPQPGDDGNITPNNIVAICSKKLNPSQQNYSVYKKELYGVIYSLRKFHSYVWGRVDTVLYTDHKPLTYLFQSTNLCVALQQWLDVILDYKFEIRYREGVLNILPDMLSRMYVSTYRGRTWGVPNIGDGIRIEADAKTRDQVLEDVAVRGMDLMGEEVAAETQLTKEQRIKLIQTEHSLGHFGRDAIMNKLKSRNISWSGMRRDIQDELIRCDACIKYTVTSAGYHPSQYITASEPWSHIQIDTSVHLPESADGMKVLLVVIDVFTGYIILRALPSNTMERVAKELWSIFALFGVPKIIQSDNGTEFVNQVIQSLTKLINVDHRLITPYNPRCDGKVERSIGTIMSVIKKMLNGTYQLWPMFVEFAQLTFNRRITQLTGSSPFALMFGRDGNELQNYSNVNVDDIKGDERDWVEHQHKLLSIIYPAVNSRVLSKKEQMIEAINKKRRVVVSGLPAGSTVMYNDPKRINKFEPKYIGPYTVIRRTRNGTYALRDGAGDILDHHVTLDQLKVLSKKRSKVNTDNIYEVERIIGHKGEAGNYIYLTKWKGYGDESNTWEPQNNFFDDNVVKEYWKNINTTTTASAMPINNKRQSKS